MNNDSRTHYFRFSKAGFQTVPVDQAFLDARPLIKTPADEEAGTPAVYYKWEDGLTYEQALRIYAPHQVALMAESESNAPENLGSLADHEVLPEEMTHAFWGMHGLSALEIAAAVRQADALGKSINEILIPWGATKNAYLATGDLPE